MFVLTYHGLGDERSPLFVEPRAFVQQLDRLTEAGFRAVTVRELARTAASGAGSDRVAAITFDDGLASVVEHAAPLLEARGLAATVFCVAGHLGGRSDWPSALPGARAHAVAPARDVAALAATGIEIGSHGWLHAPLVDESGTFLHRELVDSRRALEEVVQRPVTSFAYPYGAAPSPAARALVEATYEAACTTTIGRVEHGGDVYALPRIDAHYLRRPELFERLLDGTLDSYLRLRRLAARARRLVRRDYLVAGAAGA